MRKFIAALAAPGVDVDHAIGRYGHLPRVTDIVGEHRRAKARRQRDPAVVARAGRTRGRAQRILRGRWRGDQQQEQSERANGESSAAAHATAYEQNIPHRLPLGFADKYAPVERAKRSAEVTPMTYG